MHHEITHAPILGPVIALVGWTLIMWVWMYAKRIPAMKRAGIDAKSKIGGTGEDLRQAIDPKSQWPADNYNHLLEQPVIFYAIALTLAIMGQGDVLNVQLAWAYVGLRVLHSLVQVTSNRVMIRFLVFSLASLTLAALTVRTAMIYCA